MDPRPPKIILSISPQGCDVEKCSAHIQISTISKKKRGGRTVHSDTYAKEQAAYPFHSF